MIDVQHRRAALRLAAAPWGKPWRSFGLRSVSHRRRRRTSSAPRPSPGGTAAQRTRGPSPGYLTGQNVRAGAAPRAAASPAHSTRLRSVWLKGEVRKLLGPGQSVPDRTAPRWCQRTGDDRNNGAFAVDAARRRLKRRWTATNGKVHGRAWPRRKPLTGASSPEVVVSTSTARSSPGIQSWPECAWSDRVIAVGRTTRRAWPGAARHRRRRLLSEPSPGRIRRRAGGAGRDPRCAAARRTGDRLRRLRRRLRRDHPGRVTGRHRPPGSSWGGGSRGRSAPSWRLDVEPGGLDEMLGMAASAGPGRDMLAPCARPRARGISLYGYAGRRCRGASPGRGPLAHGSSQPFDRWWWTGCGRRYAVSGARERGRGVLVYEPPWRPHPADASPARARGGRERSWWEHTRRGRAPFSPSRSASWPDASRAHHPVRRSCPRPNGARKPTSSWEKYRQPRPPGESSRGRRIAGRRGRGRGLGGRGALRERRRTEGGETPWH